MISSVFISYATAPPDGQVAKTLRDALTKSGIKVPAWRDREKLVGGDSFTQKLGRAISDAETFLFLLSPQSVVSRWCLRELSRADNLQKPIVPLASTTLPPRRYQCSSKVCTGSTSEREFDTDSLSCERGSG
jgi:TIR domain